MKKDQIQAVFNLDYSHNSYHWLYCTENTPCYKCLMLKTKEEFDLECIHNERMIDYCRYITPLLQIDSWLPVYNVDKKNLTYPRKSHVLVQYPSSYSYDGLKNASYLEHIVLDFILNMLINTHEISISELDKQLPKYYSTWFKKVYKLIICEINIFGVHNITNRKNIRYWLRPKKTLL